MVVGDQYAVATRRSEEWVRVTFLGRADRRAYVRVRFESGMVRGETREIPSVNIVAAWAARFRPQPVATPSRPRRVPLPGPWPPEKGQSVHWASTGDIAWRVDRVDGGLYEISGTLFTLRQRREVPLEELRPAVVEVEDRPAPARIDLPEEDEDQTADEIRAETPAATSEPVADDVVARLVADLVFSERAIAQYARLVKRGVPREELSDRLRAELLEHGQPKRIYRERLNSRRRRRLGYLRIRVRGRFDVEIADSPSKGELATSYIDELKIHQSRARRSTPRRRTPRRRKR